MANDLISVVVPAYNVAGCLGRCLDSVLAQSYPCIEIIVVDDGSSDETPQVIEKYEILNSNRIHMVRTMNGGPANARLKGVSIARGTWVGFVDADDEIEPNMFESLLNNAVKYNAQISHCGYQTVLPDGEIFYFYNTGRLVQQDRITGLKDLLEGAFVEPGLCNKLFHKSLFQGLLHDSIMDTSVRINEDLLMNYYLFSAAEKMVYEDQCPYHYIVRENSATRSKLDEKKIYDPIRVKEIIRRSAPGELKTDAQRAYLNTCINSYNGLVQAGKEYQKDAERIRSLLEKEKATFSVLGNKREMMAKLIVKAPAFYGLVYGIYSRYFQENPYR